MQYIKPVSCLLQWCGTEVLYDHVNDFRVSFQYSKMQSHISATWFLVFDHCYFAHSIFCKLVHNIADNVFCTVKGSSLKNVPVLVYSQINKLLIVIVAFGEEAEIVILYRLKDKLVLVSLVRPH